MNDEQIESILDDFRNWFRTLPVEPPARPVAESVGLHTLVAQFTALRHEVNLQTKAARSAIEQSNAVLQELQARDAAPADDPLAPVVKLVLDLHDALSIAHSQMAKLQPGEDISDAPPLPRPGFLARFFGADTAAVEADRTRLRAANAKLRERIAGAADGYAMSLRRIERAFPELGLEPIACLGMPFEPEFMEVVDTVAAENHAPGTVVEIVRHGFLRNDFLQRYAQVKVAK
jgi:molecular chaperone GrpE